MKTFTKATEALNGIAKGAFVTSGDDKYNTMTIGWGTVGIMWAMPVFIVPVRESRFTKQFIDESGVFTISIPFGNKMDKALEICGTKSGRDIDKFAEAGITAKRAETVNSYVIDGCDKYYECRVLFKTVVEKDKLDPKAAARYPNNNMHTLYYGEIIKEY